MSAGAIQRDEVLFSGQSEVFLAHPRHPTKPQGLPHTPRIFRIWKTENKVDLFHSSISSLGLALLDLLSTEKQGDIAWQLLEPNSPNYKRKETPHRDAKKRKPHRGTLTWQKGFSQGETRAKINCLRRMAKLAYLLWQEFLRHFNFKSFLCISEHKVMACVLCLNMEQRGPAPLLYVTDSETAFMKLVGGWVGAQIDRQHAQISVGKFFLSHAFGMQTLFSQRNSHKW